jgi:hypothetical protein
MDVAAIEALTATASTALVTAAVTDTFEGVRRRVAQMFGRGQPDPKIDQKLVTIRDRLAAAAPAEFEQVRAALAVQWQTRFADLLTDHPDAEAEVRGLVEELQRELPAVAPSGHSVAAARDVNVTAEGGSVAAGVIHGDVVPPGPPVPGPAGG